MKKNILFVFLFILLIAIVFGVIDFFRVKNSSLPIFCIKVISADDAGSGSYIGLGYAFDIKGNFLPDEPAAGVSAYNYKVLGIKIINEIK